MPFKQLDTDFSYLTVMSEEQYVIRELFLWWYWIFWAYIFSLFPIDFLHVIVAYTLFIMPQLKLNWCWFTFINNEEAFFVWIHQFIWLHVLTFHIHMNIYVQEIYAHNWKGEIRIPQYNFYFWNAHKNFVARVFTKHTPKRYAYP